jgi:ABC-type oligopeptide transport system ATPase subunit
MPVLLAARNLRKSFRTPSGPRLAADGVSLDIFPAETLALVGESGCGKTTLARLLLRLLEPDAGEIVFQNKNLLAAQGRELRALRREMQMVFQDPYASLDPRMRVESIVAEPLAIHEPLLSRTARRERVGEALAAVGLAPDALRRFPHEFSGGQRQRVGIARALVLRPKLVVADEPVSALDVSVGAQILVLLDKLQREFHLTYLLIAHSLPVVAQLASRVAVMRAGQIVELGPVDRILRSPAHPYTYELLSSVPTLPDRS